MSYLSHYLAQVTGPCIGEAFYDANVTLTVDDEIFALVAVIGGGGGGALAYHATTSNCLLAQGGAAGGLVMKLVRMKPNVDYDFTVGAGGEARASDGGAQHGNAGSASTFISDDGAHSLSASGGAAGTQIVYATAGGATQSIATQTQVSGTGGHWHYEGGPGGSIEITNANHSNMTCASGGGGVNLWNGTGAARPQGGKIILTSQANTERATGGGGVGGRAGRILAAADAGEIATGGGGTGGAGGDKDTGSSDSSTSGGAALTGSDLGLGNKLGPLGAGGDGEHTSGSGSDGGDGGGGGGCVIGGAGSYSAGDGGIFGGGGGCSNTVSGQTNLAGDGGYGAGGGGLCARHSSATNYLSGAGGGGCMIVRYFTIPGRIL